MMSDFRGRQLVSSNNSRLDSRGNLTYKPDVMLRRHYASLGLALLLALVAALMIGAMRQDSATVDEPVFLGAGYSYWLGERYWLEPPNPPLAILFATLPLKMLDVKLPPRGQAIVSARAIMEESERWDMWGAGNSSFKAVDVFPHGPDFYYFPFYEGIYFGNHLIYGGQNDAEKLIFWGRIPEVLLTLLLGLVVYLWTWRLRTAAAGLLAASVFLLNPVVLAYGHIVQTDIGIALLFPLAVWSYVWLLEKPGGLRATGAGVVTGLALAVKHSAVILAPTFAVLWWLHRSQHRDTASLGWRRVLAVAVTAWCVILLVYLPHGAPAPPIDPVTAAKLGVPNWFLWLRPMLVPREYFKGLALVLSHSSSGHEAYLNGVWSHSGWWLYFPIAFAMKTPPDFLFFAGVGLLLAVRFRQKLSFAEKAAWISAAVYLLCAMRSKTDIGVRYLLPVYPLISVGAACAWSRWIESIAVVRRRLVCGLAAAMPVAALVTVAAVYPSYISYINTFGGGNENGYLHLLDSNYDWGQDLIRLKSFLDQQDAPSLYIDYFGPQPAIDYYHIPAQPTDGESAKSIQRGVLIVSAHCLMHPEWRWLRTSRQPLARIGDTLFVYRLDG